MIYKNSIYLVITIFMGGLAYTQAFAWGGCSHDESHFRCVEYLSNYDGDTIKVNIDGLHPVIGSAINIRLRGIDTAERDSYDDCEVESAERSTQEVQEILSQAQRIDLKNIARGKYFRLIADVIADGKNLGDHLIKKDLAVPYKGTGNPSVDWCNYL